MTTTTCREAGLHPPRRGPARSSKPSLAAPLSFKHLRDLRTACAHTRVARLALGPRAPSPLAERTSALGRIVTYVEMIAQCTTAQASTANAPASSRTSLNRRWVSAFRLGERSNLALILGAAVLPQRSSQCVLSV